MSDLDIFEEVGDGVIEFPTFDPGQSRSTVYKTGTTTRFEVPGSDVEGAIAIESARLVRIRARRQPNRNDEMDLVSFVEVVVDEQVGLVTPEGKVALLSPYSAPQWANWQDRKIRPHRVYGQNWGSDEEALMRLVNFCRHNFGFRVTKNPPMNTRANAKYKQRIRYLFEARPATPILESSGGQQDWSKFGAPVDAFEIRVNPDYEAGFKSFVDGIRENLQRMVIASKVTDNEERELALTEASRFSGSITGITDSDGTSWARNADVTTLVVGGQEFRIWNPGGDGDLTLDDLKASDEKPAGPDDGELSLDDFTLPGNLQAQVDKVESGNEPF
ncbi:MAG TPA: hypothetical protein VJ742_12530 [Nitrososphaera sp.]|nr:hypothetical protein [Nitrososphaera sp.]